MKTIQKRKIIIQDQGNKQFKTLHSLNPNKILKSTEDLFPIDLLNKDVRDEIEKNKTIDGQIFRANLI